MLLNQVKELVSPHLCNEMMEAGYNRFDIEDGNLAIDIECEHYIERIDRFGVMHCIIAPRKVLVYIADEDGDYNTTVDMTRKFDEYKYELYS